jgi:hypothetical protein
MSFNVETYNADL